MCASCDWVLYDVDKAIFQKTEMPFTHLSYMTETSPMNIKERKLMETYHLQLC